MPSIKTLTNLVLVIITVLIITIILTRISKPVEVHAVEGVYNQFFGETQGDNTQDYLTLENGQLLLHVERLPENAVLTVITFPPTRENKREYTKQPNPIHLSMPEPFLTVYALGIQHEKDWTVQRYILTNPNGNIPFSRIEEGSTTALNHGATIETLQSILSHYTISSEEKQASLDGLVRANSYVCSRSADSKIQFKTCKKQDGKRLFDDPHTLREDEQLCLTHVWNGKMPQGITCREREEIRDAWQQGGRTLLLLALLDKIRVSVPDASDCTQRVRTHTLLISVNTKVVDREEMRRIHEYYARHVFFSHASFLRGEDCTVSIPLQGDVRVWRIR